MMTPGPRPRFWSPIDNSYLCMTCEKEPVAPMSARCIGCEKEARMAHERDERAALTETEQLLKARNNLDALERLMGRRVSADPSRLAFHAKELLSASKALMDSVVRMP